MFGSIGDYLSKFKNLTFPDAYIKDELLILIKKDIGINLDKKSISIINGVAYIKASHIYKNEVYFKKTLLLQKLKEKNIPIKDIR